LPFFGDLPYLGTFFRSNRELQNEVELLITVTPNFAGAMDPCEVPNGGPGLNTVSPTDRELYWKGYMEVPLTPDVLDVDLQARPSVLAANRPQCNRNMHHNLSTHRASFPIRPQ
jgi:Flp pilus assembly secretin CpaC